MPSVAPQLKPNVTNEKLTQVALKLFFNVGKQWELDNNQLMKLLGDPPRTTFYKWKGGEAKALSRDTLERISMVQGIYKSLRIIFSSEAQADKWVAKPNEAFAGASALDVMLGGSMMDIARVRIYLDAMRG